MLRIVAIAAGVVIAAPAFGQGVYSVPIEEGRVVNTKPASIPNRAGMSDAERGRITAVDFATCTVAHHAKAVREILTLPFSSTSMAAIAKVASSECLLGGDLRMATISARAALYQAVYRADFGRAQPPLLPTPMPLEDPVGLQGDAAAAAFMVRFADCVVRADLPNSRAAVLAAVGGIAEAAAYSALVPSFGSCMPEGAVIHINKALMSGGLSEALYREALAARHEASGKNN